MAELENKIQFHFIEIDLYALQKRLVIVQQVSFFFEKRLKTKCSIGFLILATFKLIVIGLRIFMY